MLPKSLLLQNVRGTPTLAAVLKGNGINYAFLLIQTSSLIKIVTSYAL